MQVLAHRSESELKALAAEVAGSISIRTYYIIGADGEQIQVDGKHGTRGNSRDDRRNTTPEEASIIYNIIYAALLAVDWQRKQPETFQAIRNTAEFAGHTFFNKFDFEVNCYDTIYTPLYKIINEWEKEELN